MGEKSLLIASGNFENAQNLDIIPDNVRRRRSISVKEKLDILNLIDSGCKLSVVARKYGISLSTASTINKERYKIKMLSDQCNIDPDRKRMRLATYRDVDEAVHMWFQQQRMKNIPINGPILQQKAKEFGLLLRHTNFEGSKGWLFRFREKYGLTAKGMREKEDSNACCSAIGMTDEEIVNSVTENSVHMRFSEKNTGKKEIVESYLVPDIQLCEPISEVSHNQSTIDAYGSDFTNKVSLSKFSTETLDSESAVEMEDTDSTSDIYNCGPIVEYNNSGPTCEVAHNQCTLETYDHGHSIQQLISEPLRKYNNGFEIDHINAEIIVVNDQISTEYHCKPTFHYNRTIKFGTRKSVNFPDAITFAEKLALFLRKHDVPSHVLESMNVVSKFIETDLCEHMKQRKITDYFKP